MPGKRKRGGAPPAGKAGGSKRRKKEETMDLQDINSEDFADDVALGVDGEDADIMFNASKRTGEEAAVDPRYAYKVEGKDIDMGLGDIDEEEGELAMEEQQRRLGMLDDDDFAVDGLEVPAAAAPKKGKAKKSPAAVQQELDALSKFLSSAEASLASEQVTKDYSALSAADKQAIVAREAPELKSMLADFSEKLAMVKDVLAPLLQKVRDGEVPTSAGVGFIELKMHLFLTYLMNLTFYFLLKAEGQPIKGNPVVKKLVELRAYMDKLKPVEKKLQHQISRLLSRAAKPDGAAGDADRANVAALADADGDEGTDGAGKYQAPRALGQTLSKEEKKTREARLIEKAGELKSKKEEELMMRAPTSRKQDKKLKQAKEDAQFDDDDAIEMAPGLENSLLGGGMSLMDRAKSLRDKRLLQVAEEEEDDQEDEEGAEEGSLDGGEEEGDEEDAEANSADEEQAQARAFYQEEVERAEAAKKKKKRALNAARQHGGKAPKENFGNLAGEVVDGHRKIASEIKSNRGLVPQRPKRFKNPRVRSKIRAKKQLNKVVGQVKPKVYPTGKYKGEKQIRTDVIRSHPLV
eukprot:TRINITY_DN13402_c0_g1_i1.p1 TRINITY_DN13402_c0_g1~~TRINITY_DN13402_c0_g1_i1.p1  ORF type:complete len:578 (+),score=311.46 TRINITY_DN13402_c0_g1_i1:62-1795(+)